MAITTSSSLDSIAPALATLLTMSTKCKPGFTKDHLQQLSIFSLAEPKVDHLEAQPRSPTPTAFPQTAPEIEVLGFKLLW